MVLGTPAHQRSTRPRAAAASRSARRWLAAPRVCLRRESVTRPRAGRLGARPGAGPRGASRAAGAVFLRAAGAGSGAAAGPARFEIVRSVGCAAAFRGCRPRNRVRDAGGIFAPARIAAARAAAVLRGGGEPSRRRRRRDGAANSLVPRLASRSVAFCGRRGGRRLDRAAGTSFAGGAAAVDGSDQVACPRAGIESAGCPANASPSRPRRPCRHAAGWQVPQKALGLEVARTPLSLTSASPRS